MINKDKIQNTELVRIPLNSTEFTDFNQSLAEWLKDNPDKANWPLIDIRTNESIGGPEIMAILSKPDDHTEDLKNHFDEKMNKEAEESIEAENNAHQEEEENREVEQ